MSRQVDSDASLTALAELRHDPHEPNPANEQAEEERRRLARRERDRVERNRLLWADHYMRLAERARQKADDYEAKARALAPREGVR